MRSNYKPLGKYIREVDNRDTNKNVELLTNISSLQSENSQVKEGKKDNCDDILFREQNRCEV